MVLFISFITFFAVDVNCEVCVGLFSAADRCFPRARLQPLCPGKGYVDVVRKERFWSTFLRIVLRGLQTRAGTAITRPTENLCSRRTRKASAALHRTKKIGLYFRSGMLRRSLYQLRDDD